MTSTLSPLPGTGEGPLRRSSSRVDSGAKVFPIRSLLGGAGVSTASSETRNCWRGVFPEGSLHHAQRPFLCWWAGTSGAITVDIHYCSCSNREACKVEALQSDLLHRCTQHLAEILIAVSTHCFECRLHAILPRRCETHCCKMHSVPWRLTIEVTHEV